MITLVNGNVFINNKFEKCNVLIENDKITKIGDFTPSGKIIDCLNKIVVPSFIDPHVHLREPGFSHKETILQGSKACARGGYTKVFLMPNIEPKPNNLENITYINNLLKKDSVIECVQSGCITMNQTGLGNDTSNMEEIAPYVCGFSDDGNGVYTSKTMFEAMKKASKLNKPILSHCEDRDMLYGGVMHEGEVSKKLNMPGILGISETLEIARNAILAKEANCHLHICHISIKDSVNMVRYFKDNGCKITCEVSPHHLTLTDEDININDANYKMNPPLSKKSDQDALIKGLLDGTIDCIATDHAPHTLEEKASGFLRAPFGIAGIEIAFSVLYTYLVKKNILPLELILNKLSLDVAKTFNIDNNNIEVGNLANIAVIDLDKEYIFNKELSVSKGKNTPYHNVKLCGDVIYTILKGEIVYGL